MPRKIIKLTICFILYFLLFPVTYVFSQSENDKATIGRPAVSKDEIKESDILKKIEDEIRKQFENESNIQRLGKALSKSQNASEIKELNSKIENLNNMLKDSSETIKEYIRITESLKKSKDSQIVENNNYQKKLENLDKDLKKKDESISNLTGQLASKRDSGQRGIETLVDVLLKSSYYLDNIVINILQPKLDANSPLHLKIKNFQEASKAVKDADMFLFQGKGNYNDVYKKFLLNPPNKNDFPALNQKYELLVSQFANFIDIAKVLDQQITKMEDVSDPNIREANLLPKVFPQEIAMYSYPFLLTKLDENFTRHTPLNINFNLK